MKRQSTRRLLVAIGVLLCTTAVAPAGAAPGPSLYIGEITVLPDNLVEGTAATVQVLLVNNGTIDLVLWNITVNDTVSGADAVVVGSLDNVSVPAGTNVTLSFPWAPPGGVHVLAARAEIRAGNSTFPLPPAIARVQVNRAPINEPLTLVGAIVTLLVVVLAIAALPALFDRARKPYSEAPGSKALDSGKEPGKD